MMDNYIRAIPTTILPGPVATVAAGHVLSTTSAGTVVASLAPSAFNQTASNLQDKMEQEELDSRMPIYLILACGGLLAIIFVLGLPRFLVRLYASLHWRRARRAEAAATTLEAPRKPDHNHRVLAGGDLDQGWVLIKSTGSDMTLSDPASIFSEPSQMFEPGKEGRPVASSLSSPPHVTPIVDKLPFTNFLYRTPLAQIPYVCRFFRSYATVAEILVASIYIALCGFSLGFKSNVATKKATSGFGEDYTRTGLIAMSQAPVAIALGVHGNLIGLLLGTSYERLRLFHKVSGRLIFLAALVHASFFIHKWVVKGTLAKSSASHTGMTGYIAFSGLALLTLTSLPVVRQYAYSTFKFCHILGIIFFLAGLGVHVEVATPWCIGAGVIYGISLLMTACKTRVASANLIALPGSPTTLITIPDISSGWRAGQHIRIRVLGLGHRSLESHPFTIATAPHCGGLVLIAKSVGDWTNSLYQLASSGHQPNLEDGQGSVGQCRTTVIVEGPYGGLGNTLLPSFGSVVLFAAGSGISHSIGLAQDLIARSPSGVIAARTVDLVWAVRNEQTAHVILPTLTTLVKQAYEWERASYHISGSPTALRVHIFITQQPADSPLTLLTSHTMEKDSSLGHDGSEDSHESQESYNSSDPAWLHPGTMSSMPSMPPPAAKTNQPDWLSNSTPPGGHLSQLPSKLGRTVRPMSRIREYRGRPDASSTVTRVVEETIVRLKSITRPEGVLVTACGPESFVDDCRMAVNQVSSLKKSAVGGVEFEAELFGV